MQLIDIHTHIEGRDYRRDRAAVLARAQEAGVAALVTAGTNIPSSAAAVGLADNHPAIWAVVGIHPHDAKDVMEASYQQLRELAHSDRVLGIGEIGLDYYRELSPRATQERVFERQLDLAAELDLPVVIHSRDADAPTERILASWVAHRRSHGGKAPFGVMHCYAYGPERLDAYLALDFFISVPGVVTYSHASGVQGAASVAPATALVLETDAPYLSPQSQRGKRNEPGFIAETANKVAQLRGISVEEVAAQTCANAERLFRRSLLGALVPQAARDSCGVEP